MRCKLFSNFAKLITKRFNDVIQTESKTGFEDYVSKLKIQHHPLLNKLGSQSTESAMSVVDNVEKFHERLY